MPTKLISEARLRSQARYYYAVLILWPTYLFLLPAVWVYTGWGVALYLVFPGIYLFTWLGYLMHESWHKYVPNVKNRFFYNAFALMLLSDPQLYHMIHGVHHSQVHTYQDAEFHPLGEIKHRGVRVVYNWLEFVFGIAFLVGVTSVAIPRDPRFAQKYRLWKLAGSIGGWIILFGGLGYLSHLVFGVGPAQVVGAYALSFWLNAFVLHQSQLIEHGNLIITGAFNQRNIKTRNLKPAGIVEKVFLFLTHNDSREHVLHHTLTTVHSRPFPGEIPLPAEAVSITLGDYVRLVGRMLKGEVDTAAAP